MKTHYIILWAIILTACAQSKLMDEAYSIQSPDGSLQLQFDLKEGAPQYTIQRGKQIILEPSRLGFVLAEAEDLLTGFEIIKADKSAFDETWEPLWREESQVKNQYNELKLQLQELSDLKRRMDVVFRVFDDGVSFRYYIPQQENIKEINILSEESSFNFAGDPTVWFLECDTLLETWEGGFDSYERLYQQRRMSELNTLIQTPATFILDDDVHLAIHEANLTNYSSMTLAFHSEEMESHLVPWPDGVKVKTHAPMYTPWRTIQIAENAPKLADSRMIMNLNEPSVIKDVSWIQPMKYVGIWWEMHMAKSTWEFGPNHGANTENAIKYIDFAADHDIKGVLVEGWNLGWEDWINNPNFDFVQPYPDYDLPFLVSYAKDKGVSIIAHHETGGDIANYERQMEDAFKLLKELGVHAVKTGYVGAIKSETPGLHHHGQAMVNHYRKVLETAAKYEVCVVSHEPIKPTGIRRTYPNMLSREAMRGMEFNAWSDGNPPSHTTILPFTMGLAGPLDYTPGIFKLKFDEYRKGHSTHTTLANQLALYVTLFSPVQMAADFPEHYEGNPAFKFIRDIPTDWEKSLVIDANIGQYVATARKSKIADEWFVGVVNNEEPRQLELTIDFLDTGVTYQAEIYSDTPETSTDTNPEIIAISQMEIRNGEKLSVNLAGGGGQAIRLTPIL